MQLRGFLRRLMWLVLTILLQSFVLNRIFVCGYVAAFVLPLFIASFDRSEHRIAVLLWSFGIGCVQDMLNETMGLAMASSVLCAMCQMPLLKACSGSEDRDAKLPSISSMGFGMYSLYLCLLVVIFHASYYLLEAFSLNNWRMTILSIAISSLFSFVLSLLFQLFRRKSS